MAFPEEDWLAQIDPERLQDAARLVQTEKACLCPMDGPEGIHPFILPSGERVNTTTQFCTRVRHGQTFHLLVSFKSEEEVRAELASYDHTRDSDMVHGSDEYKARKRILKIRRRLSAERGPGGGSDSETDGSESDFDSDIHISEHVKQVTAGHYPCWRLCEVYARSLNSRALRGDYVYVTSPISFCHSVT